MVSAANLCLLCKGSRALCGMKNCPKLASLNVLPRLNETLSDSFFGPSPNVFVGRVGYPNLSIGPLGAIQSGEFIDAPQNWFGLDYEKIIEFRAMLLRSKHKQNIFSKSKFINDVQELALSVKPTDIEMKFKSKPSYKVSFSDVVQPMGPSASLEKLRIAENPKIPEKIDYIVSDELKANESVINLYDVDLDVYKITTILSAGILGLENNKKLVPTRWSITATDDIIAKNMIGQIKNYNCINEFLVFESKYLDNHFLILLIPGNWEYENFEAWAPGSVWTSQLKEPEILQEYEPFSGRTSYAEEEAGGYYAARLGVVEYLHKTKKQARVVVFREVYEGYTVPLGVWVVRETVRNAFKNSAASFNSINEALSHINSKLRININEYIKRSNILKQKRLDEF